MSVLKKNLNYESYQHVLNDFKLLTNRVILLQSSAFKGSLLKVIISFAMLIMLMLLK